MSKPEITGTQAAARGRDALGVVQPTMAHWHRTEYGNIREGPAVCGENGIDIVWPSGMCLRAEVGGER